MPRAANASAISRPTYPAPMMIAEAGVPLGQVLVEGEGVAHGVDDVDTVYGGAELVEPGDAAWEGGSAPVPTTSSS